MDEPRTSTALEPGLAVDKEKVKSGSIGRKDLRNASVSGKDLYDIRGLEVFFPVRQSFFRAMVSTEKRWVRAVDGVSFTIGAGEILALVGESGCGKTTTGRTLLGLEGQTGGQIIYKGLEVGKFTPGAIRDYRRHCQIIFQDPYNAINPKHTIFDIVAEPLLVNHLTGSEHEKEERVIRALEEAGLRPARDYLYRYPHELSGGQRQRVCIAGAIVLEPDMIVADEPVASLDVSIRNDILKLMVQHKKELGVTYLFITHDLSLAWVISDASRHVPSHRGHVPRQDRRDRRHRGGRVQPPAPLHQGADLGDPGARPDRPARAHHPHRRDAQPGGHPAGLPVPPALPRGHGHLFRAVARRRADPRHPLRRLPAPERSQLTGGRGVRPPAASPPAPRHRPTGRSAVRSSRRKGT